jgi:replicative DNA helicase
MISSPEIERRVLSGILQHPQLYASVRDLLSDDDFFSIETKLHVTLFRLIRRALDNAEVIDGTL